MNQWPTSMLLTVGTFAFHPQFIGLVLHQTHPFAACLCCLPLLLLCLLLRSADLETKGDVSLPSYRGDIINGPDFTTEARVPDPWRLVRAYNQSAATLNLLRGFSTGGYAGEGV